MRSHEERLRIASEILEGLSVGDALGESLSYQHHRARAIADFSFFSAGSVRFTDDTEMALAVYETLKLTRGVDEDTIAWAFASRFKKDPERGYGKMARRILESLCTGSHWKDVSMIAFGSGSFGNGAAMRVAPLGGYFSDDLNAVVEAASKSARVTHFHPEGIAGAIAVAVATAAAHTSRHLLAEEASDSVWKAVVDYTPEGKVRAGISRAWEMRDATALEVVREVGNGAGVSAQDTLPFCIWSACRNLLEFREALLSTVEVGGDCDTNCAIVCGIVTAHGGIGIIPREWLRVREPLNCIL